MEEVELAVRCRNRHCDGGARKRHVTPNRLFVKNMDSAALRTYDSRLREKLPSDVIEGS